MSSSAPMRSKRCIAAVVALSAAAALVVVPARDGGPFALLGSAPAAATATAGPVSSSGYRPAASFTALQYPVKFFSRIFGAADSPDAGLTYGRMWFGEVTADERSQNLELSYAVEDQHDPAGYQFCETPSTCDDVNVRVTPAGLLYLHKQRPTDDNNQFGYFADFPTRTVELSAADDSTPLKMYREVLVRPPTLNTGCEDYGEDSPDAYTCLFLREVIPEGAGSSSNEAMLRSSLPGLVQDASNYSLVFAEEFDGTPPAADAAGCRDGLSTLDNDVWNYYNACGRTDSRGEPCGNVVSGQLVFGISGHCAFWLISAGKLHAKYGYLEVKFTVNVDSWSAYHNYNVILYARGEKLRYLLDRYGVNIDDREDFLVNLDSEIDVIEMDVNAKAHTTKAYRNYYYKAAESDIFPAWSSKWYEYCRNEPTSVIRNPNLPCKSTDTFTVTHGFEWTPRGYRTFIKVDGFHDDMTVVPKDKINVNVKPVSGDHVTGPHRELTGATKDAYFEYIDPDDADTLLEQVAVSHVPLPLSIETWGYMDSRLHPHIRTRMKIDYIRMWQPEDHYSTMEPVYQ